MKTMKIAMGAVVVALMASVGQADTIIYSETFDGDGTNSINGATTTTGGGTWVAKNANLVMNNGTMPGQAGSALLPFSPETNQVYTLSMDLNHTGSKFIGLGFTRDGIDAGVADTGNRFQNRGGIAWFKYGNDGAIQTFGGLNEANEIANTAVYAPGAVVLMVKIDTTGDGSSFTADFLIDGVSIVGSPQTVTVAIDDINYVGITGQGSLGTGVVDNFELRDVSAIPSQMTWVTTPYAVSGSAITMVATAFVGYEYYFENTTVGNGSHDSDWQDSASYTDSGLTPETAYTYTVTAREKLVPTNVITPSTAASATTLAEDNTPPNPDPMTWITVPVVVSSTEVTMTATNAVDAEGNGVEYFFACVSGGGDDSGWQSGTTYNPANLAEGTTYEYAVKARDLSDNYNETEYSTTHSVTTPATDNNPPAPDPMTWASVPTSVDHQSITMTATSAVDAEGNGVEYYFACISGGGDDSGWQASPIYTDGGLDPETIYSYAVRARDNSPDGFNETANSTTNSATTAAAPSVEPGLIYSETFDGDGTSGIDGMAPTIGDGTWAAKNASLVTTDGTIAGAAGSALLPFSPKTNEVYTLSMDLNHTGDKYIALGFTQSGINPAVLDTSNRINSLGGSAMIWYGQNSAIEIYGGLNKINLIPNTGTFVGNTIVNITIKLDTTGDGSSFTADFLIDDVSIVGGPQTVSTPVDDLNYVAISAYGSNRGTGVIDNFELRDGTTVEVPEVDDLSIEVVGSELGLGWYGVSGGSYILQSTESLTSDSWTNITTVAGTNGPIFETDEMDKDQQFYRVKLDSPE